MADKNYNIRQVTNYDLENAPVTTYIISVPERATEHDEYWKYPISFVDEEVEYKTALENVEILKLGYCCSQDGIIYPIFLEMDGEYVQIDMNKECMYEFQPENWKNINEEEPREKTSDVIVTGVRVPANIKFTLEYVTEE